MQSIKLSQIIKEWAYSDCVGFADIEDKYKNAKIVIIDDITTTTTKTNKPMHSDPQRLRAGN